MKKIVLTSITALNLISNTAVPTSIIIATGKECMVSSNSTGLVSPNDYVIGVSFYSVRFTQELSSKLY